MQIYRLNQMIIRCFVFVAIINLGMAAVSLLGLSEDAMAGAALASQQLAGTVSIYAFLACIYACAKTRGAARSFSAVLLAFFAIVMQIENGSTFVGLGILPFGALLTAVLLLAAMARANWSVFLICVSEVLAYLGSRSASVLLVSALVYIFAKLGLHFAAVHVGVHGVLIMKQTILLSLMTLFIYSACPYLKQERNR